MLLSSRDARRSAPREKMNIPSIVISLVAGVSLFGATGCSESVSNNFRNYEEARESGIMNRGWIPGFIPGSAREIKEHHKMDAPHIHVEFDFDPGDIYVFEESCSLHGKYTYTCANSGYPVTATISDDNHAVIRSLGEGI